MSQVDSLHSPFADKFQAFGKQPQSERSEQLRYQNALVKTLLTAFLLSVHLVTQIKAVTTQKMCQSDQSTTVIATTFRLHTCRRQFSQTKVHATTINLRASVLHSHQRLDRQTGIVVATFIKKRGQVMMTSCSREEVMLWGSKKRRKTTELIVFRPKGRSWQERNER
jgi:hypothetical protein